MTMSATLYQALCKILQECGPFASTEALRAIFAHPRLRPWQESLPETNSSQERVEQVIAFLADRFNTQGQNALVLLLQVLRDRLHPEDLCHARLNRVAADLAAELAPAATRPALTIEADVERRRGLIAAVSTGPPETPADSAAGFHLGNEPFTLTHCWLIAGPGDKQPGSSPANALRLRDTLQARGVVVDVWQLDSTGDVEDIFLKVQAMIDEGLHRYRLREEEIIVDTTGGTKTMTIGMMLAALAKQVPLQYMEPNNILADGRADRQAGSVPRQVDITFVRVDEPA